MEWWVSGSEAVVPYESIGVAVLNTEDHQPPDGGALVVRENIIKLLYLLEHY